MRVGYAGMGGDDDDGDDDATGVVALYILASRVEWCDRRMCLPRCTKPITKIGLPSVGWATTRLRASSGQQMKGRAVQPRIAVVQSLL